jgi:Protein of unknown function (DUF1203)
MPHQRPYHRPEFTQEINIAGFRYSGISSAVAAEARQTMRSPQYGHPAHREVARGYGPCRLCLHTFRIDQEDRLLFTYQPFLDPDCLPAPGPIFVHAEPCQRYDALEFPPDFRQLPLVVEGFRANGTLAIQERVGTESPERIVARVFLVADVAYAHLRNGEAGCYMARVERCYPCD